MRTSSAAQQFAIGMPLAGALIVLLPALAAAQEPVRSFDQLNTRLKVGDTVWVTDAQGREVKGTITELRDASISLNSDGQTTLQAESVRLVQQKRRGISMLLGCLIGFGAGVAGGFAFSAAAETGDEAKGGYLFPPSAPASEPSSARSCLALEIFTTPPARPAAPASRLRP
jgi:hypothetical protein